jgi:diguanylate cyclase (GGDEF)-like protein/PAS domain S-box-containing protein
MCEGRLRILLVDDDEDAFVLTHAVLVDVYADRFEADWISSFEAAREALASNAYEVCLLDYHLGKQNGLELLREAIAQGCRTPIILLTGEDCHDVDVEAMKAGAADYLVKGQFGGSLLERSIRYAIGYAVERQQTLEALRLSEERYALAAQGANDGLWDWNLSTGRIYYSPRWKAMLGYRDDEILDRPEEWLNRVHPLDIDRVKSELEDHFRGHTPHLQTEHRMLHNDGSYRWVLTRGQAVRNAQAQSVRAAGSQTDITQRKVAEDRLLHDAFHDALTGLPNRALLIDRLERSILRARRRTEHRFAVLFLDLDGFKVVNDSLGHQTGDQLLIALSRRLETCVRLGDTIARLGGDEFVVLVDDVEDPSDVIKLADRTLEEFQRPFSLNGHELVTTVSVGIAYGGGGSDSAETILRDADIAMYQAKTRGKAGYVVFDEVMHTSAMIRMKLESDLRQASIRREFLLHYQPIVSLSSGRIESFEALLRWNNPERGTVPPDEFIPIAEETRLILPIGLWALREAVEQLRHWQSAHWARPPLTMTVNLSCRQFFQADLVYQIERILIETEVDPRCLRLEITESAIMEQVETALSALARLKSLGIRVAIDDFGKGYSSLSYLHQFPCDVLKIDRSFISRIGVNGENTEIIRTIVALAHGLGLEVVAEGIENEYQLTHLRNVGCHYGQGYLFSRPLSGEVAAELLASSTSWPMAEDPCTHTVAFASEPSSSRSLDGEREPPRKRWFSENTPRRAPSNRFYHAPSGREA